MPRCALAVSSAVTPFGRDNTRTVIAPLFSKEDGRHTFGASSSPPTQEFLRLPQMQVALLPISYRKAIQRSLTGRAARKRAKLPRLPAGCLAEVGSGSLKSHTNTTRDAFSTQTLEASPETSVTITLSHVVVYGHALRCCHGAVAPDVMLALEAGCCKHAVDFSFVCGRWQNCCFVAIVPSDPRGSLSLVVPACIRRLHFHKCVPYASAVSSTD